MGKQWPYNADKYRVLSMEDAGHIRDLANRIDQLLTDHVAASGELSGELSEEIMNARLDAKEIRGKASDIIARLTVAKNGDRLEALENASSSDVSKQTA